jgi:hypothetical protein
MVNRGSLLRLLGYASEALPNTQFDPGFSMSGDADRPENNNKMTSDPIIITLSILLGLSVLASVWLATQKRTARQRIESINQELLAVSQDASVGRRLSVPNDPEAAQLALSVNRLFDARP